MPMTVSAVKPVAHLPLSLGLLRKLERATIIDGFVPPHPANIVACGRGVAAVVLAIFDGDHALYQVGTRLAERGMVALLQDGLGVESLNDYRLGQLLDALCAANLQRLFGAVALQALEVYAIPTPWLHQDTTTLSRYGVYAERSRRQAPQEANAPGSTSSQETRDDVTPPPTPQPTHGYNKDGHPDLKQLILSVGVRGNGGIPVRFGLRDGHTSDSLEPPVALEECLQLGLAGVVGIVADSQAYSQRPLGLCLEQQVGFVTLVPRPCGIRQEVEEWGAAAGSLAAAAGQARAAHRGTVPLLARPACEASGPGRGQQRPGRCAGSPVCGHPLESTGATTRPRVSQSATAGSGGPRGLLPPAAGAAVCRSARRRSGLPERATRWAPHTRAGPAALALS